MSRYIVPANLIRTTVRLPAALLRQAKALAVKKKTTVTGLIESGLRLQLASKDTSDVPLVLHTYAPPGWDGSTHGILPPGGESWSPGKWEEWCEEQEAMTK